MKHGTTIQERLKDLRVERHLTLEELAEQTNISKSALGGYENDEYREISHGAILTLADFYGVSTDYLLCRTENRELPCMELSELHLTDDMLELLRSGQLNNRLLCEIATHKDFRQLMTDTEIYVDGIVDAQFRMIDEYLELVRAELEQQYHPQEDTALKTLEAAQIPEADYFCQVTHKTWDSILRDIRKEHENDTDSAPTESISGNLIRDARVVLRYPGSFLDMFCFNFCSRLKINYARLPKEEKDYLKRIMKKSGVYKDSALSDKRR